MRIAKKILKILFYRNIVLFFVAIGTRAGVVDFERVLMLLLSSRKKNQIVFFLSLADRKGLYCVAQAKNKKEAAASAAKSLQNRKAKLASNHYLSVAYKFCIRSGLFEAAWIYRVFLQVQRIREGGLSSLELSEISFEVATIGYDEYTGFAQSHSVDVRPLGEIKKEIVAFENDFGLGIKHLLCMSKLKSNSDDSMVGDILGRANQERRAKINYLKGKKIVVIGPSVYESESTCFDSEKILVARIGYSGKDSLASDWEYRTDVSIYKRHKIRSMIEVEKEKHCLEPFVSYLSDAYVPDVLCLGGGPSFVKSQFTGNVLGSCKLNAGLELVINLLNDGAKPVCLKNIDLFTGKYYPKGYITYNYKLFSVSKNKELDDGKVCNSFVNHCPVAHYAAYCWLWRHEKVYGDVVFTELMSGGLLNYLNKLETVYFSVVSG